ncbi:MAG: beta-ketoacyl-ACP synthase II [bacterium]|nr:beta-ketoacyl-ACP synthase II [Candidatus Sumerlaeota bacterium]
MKRVVVTGLGALTPIGNNADDYWQGLLAGRNGVGPITYFDTTDYDSRIAAQLKDYNPENHFDRKEIRKMDNFTRYAIVAGREAMKDSGLDIAKADINRIGVIIGVGMGGVATIEEQVLVLMKKGAKRVSPFLIPKMIPNMASGMVSIELGLKGPNSCICTACASSTHAIGDSFKLIQRGDAVAMVCGGAESTITPVAIAGFGNMQALSRHNDEPHKASRPFDANRDGFVMGEGSGILVLEDIDHARARGAKIYAEIVGYGLSGDAFHMTAPAAMGEGGARAMKMAIDDAGITPAEVQYINAHGTSTSLNDKLETLAIKAVFGDDAQKVMLSSNKSMIGHLIGAAGAVEAVATVKTVQNNMVPPTINYETPDPECDLDCVPNVARQAEVTYAISNSLGFGGHNCTICFKKFIA